MPNPITNTGPNRRPPTGLIEPIQMDIPVDASYFREGALLPPPHTQERDARLALYADLFNGVYPGLPLKDSRVPVNYFERTSVFLADLLTAYAPVIEGLPEDLREPITSQVSAALYQVVLDQSRYGTGLFRARAENGKPIIEGVSPRLWYPGPQYSYDTLVTKIPLTESGKYRVVVDKLAPEGATRKVFAYEGMSLGEQVGPAVEYPGIGARTIVPFPRQPAEGEWGLSMYNAMRPLVYELARRFSRNSAEIDLHGAPVMVLQRRLNQGRDVPEKGDAGDKILLKLEQYDLGDERESPIMVLPAKYESANYVGWDAQMQGIFQQIAEIENALFAATSIPAALYGMLRGGTINSGLAMKRQYAPTYVFIMRLIAQAIPLIRRTITLALLAAGRDPVPVTITLANPLDELDDGVREESTDNAE